jgi:hypothetical protein
MAVLGCVWKRGANHVPSNFGKKLFKMNFVFIFSDCFDVLMSKIIFKNKKNYFNVFLSEKYFEPSPLLQLQIHN